MAGFVVGGVTVSAWGTRLPALAAELRIDTSTIGAMFAFATVGSILGLAGAGPAANRMGPRRVIGGALIVIAVAMAAVAVGAHARSVTMVSAAFFVVGAATGVVDVAINIEGSALEGAVGRSVMPLLHGAWSIGVAVGSGIGAGAAALHISPTRQFLGEAVVIVLTAVYVVASIPSRPPATPGHGQRPRSERVRAWLRGWTDRRLLLIGLVLLGVELGESSADNWLTLAAHRDHHAPASLAALLLTVFAIGEASSRLFGGRVVDRLGRVTTIRITTAVGVLGVALFITTGSPVTVLIGVVLWAVGVSMGFPLGMSAAGEGGGNVAARINVVASIGYLAGLGGPPVIGALAQGVGLLNSLWLLVVLMLVAFACAGALRSTTASARERSARAY